MLKNISKLILIFVFGIAGGIFADQILWPYFIEKPLFYKYRLERPPIYITEKKEIAVQENTALQDSIEKVEKAIVGIKIKGAKYIQGSGLMLSRDGLMVTLATLLPQKQNFVFLVEDKTPNYQLLKKDLKNNLVLVKLEGNNFTTTGFANFNDLRLGERLFLIGALDRRDDLKKIVNEGILSFLDEDEIRTNITEKNILQGSVLFNIKGEVVGINYFTSQGINIIPAAKIRDFAGI